MTPDFTSHDMSVGRQIFAAPWRFLSAAPGMDALPAMRGLEIAVAGRSNVGKSSLLNALMGRKALARTSNTPGRTQELLFFGAGGALTLVDMPGYGYAEAPKAAIAAWTRLIHGYLSGRANLARVFVLIDARHGLKPVDEDVLTTLDRAAVSYQAVLTKADQLSPAQCAARIAATAATLARHAAAFPQVLATSSRSGEGIAELRATIARLMRERGHSP